MKKVQDMRLGRNARFKCHLDRAEHSLLIVMQDKGKDLGNFPVTASASEQQGLQLPECIRHLAKRCPIAKRSRLALDHREIVPPVVDRPSRKVMRAFDNPRVFA
jgi:hypothetical protein